MQPLGGYVCSYIPEHTFRVVAPASGAEQLRSHAGACSWIPSVASLSYVAARPSCAGSSCLLPPTPAQCTCELRHAHVPAAGIMWVGEVTAPMKLAPIWDKLLPWAAGCQQQAGVCEASSPVQPYVWERSGQQDVKVRVQFAKPLPLGTPLLQQGIRSKEMLAGSATQSPCARHLSGVLAVNATCCAAARVALAFVTSSLLQGQLTTWRNRHPAGTSCQRAQRRMPGCERRSSSGRALLRRT